MFLGLLTQAQREALVHLAHNVVVSDGDLRPGEAAMLAEMRAEMDIGPHFESRYIPVNDALFHFPSRRERIIATVALIRLSYADDTYAIEEQCFIHDLRAAFEISPSEFRALEIWVQRLVSLEREMTALF